MNSKLMEIKGSMRVKMVAAPSARAAQEWLILDSAASSMPTEEIAAGYAKANRVEGLGDIGFGRGSIVRFVRGNIGVFVRGEGEWANAAAGLAAKIDAAVVKEAAVADLKGARPVVTAGALRKAAEPGKHPNVIPVSAKCAGGAEVGSGMGHDRPGMDRREGWGVDARDGDGGFGDQDQRGDGSADGGADHGGYWWRRNRRK